MPEAIHEYEPVCNCERICEPANYKAAELMRRQGGGFAQAIATAFYRADTQNRFTLLGAFSDLFKRYYTDYVRFLNHDA